MKRGLSGKRVIVTRAPHQAEELAQPLRSAGAEVILLPTIDIAPPANAEPLRQALRSLDDYDWIVFTSANAVAAVARELGNTGTRTRAAVAAVGEATGEAIGSQLGWKVEVIPARFVAESLADAIPRERLEGKRVLLPTAAVTRDVIRPALEAKGATVDVVEAYRNVAAEASRARAQEIFRQKPIPGWIVFTSPSAIDSLVNMIGAAPLRDLAIASMGSVTSAAIRKHGLAVTAQPEKHTIAALVEAMAAS